MRPKWPSTFLLVAFVLVTLGLTLQIAQGSPAPPASTNTILVQGSLVEEFATSTASFSTTFTYTFYLPLVFRPPGLLYGQVLENGVPAIGITVTLDFCRNYILNVFGNVTCDDYQAFDTVTDETGTYRFFDMPTLLVTGSLMLPQTYEVGWRNRDSDPNRLSGWRTRTLNSYTAGDRVNIGDFDISGIRLISPQNGSVVTFPVTFQWSRRASAPSDSYSPCIWIGPNAPNMPLPPPLEIVRCNQPLGYVDSFVLERPSIIYQGDYYWVVQVYGPTGGRGATDRSTVRFSEP